MAIPRGGVVLGEVVASYFRCKLDIVVSRKIGTPSNKELAIGAVCHGTGFINEYLVNMLDMPEDYIQSEVELQKKKVKRRLMEFRGSTDYECVLKDKIVILVDHGIATGSTILAQLDGLKRKVSINTKN